MNSIGDLYIQLHATARGLADDIRNDLRRAQGGLTAQAVAMGTLIADGIKAGLSMAGNFFGEQLKNASKFSAEMESTTALFEVLLGSVEKAKQAIADIRIIDQQSPLNFSQLTQSGQMLLAMGESAEKLTDDLRLLGTVSLGNSERMGRLVYAFGQIQSLGRLAGTELRQLTELGFNPLEYISKRTGESLRELSQRMSDGKLSFGEVRLAMLDAASAGGRFNGALERMEQTFEGKMAKLAGGLKMLMIDIGDGINASLKPIMEAIIKEFGGIKPMAIAVGEAIGGWVTGFYQALGGIKGIAQSLVEVYATLSTCAQVVGVIVSYARTGLEIIGTIGTQLIQIFKLVLKSAEVGFSSLGVLIKRLVANITESIFSDINNIKNRILTMMDSISRRMDIIALKFRKIINPAGSSDYEKQINDTWNAGKTYKPSDTIPDLPTGDDPNSPTSLLFPAGSNKAITDMDMSGMETAFDDVMSSFTEGFKEIGKSAEESNAKLGQIYEEGFLGDRIRAEYAKQAEEMAKSTAGAVQQQKHSFEDLKADAIKTAQEQTDALKASDEEKAKSAKDAADKRLKAELDLLEDKTRAEEDYMSDVHARLGEITRATAQMYEEFRSMNRDATSDMVTAWITGTGKISDIVSQWANSMIRQFVQVALFGNGSSPGNGSFAGLLGSMGGLFGSTAKATGAVATANTAAGVSTSGWISSIGSLIGGFFAEGGRPPMGKVSVVGERGPELFVPDSAGTVIPNNRAASFLSAPAAAAGGGGEPPMIFNFNQSFSSGVTEAQLAGAMDEMRDATKGAVLEGVRRGGSYRRGMQT